MTLKEMHERMDALTAARNDLDERISAIEEHRAFHSRMHTVLSQIGATDYGTVISSVLHFLEANPNRTWSCNDIRLACREPKEDTVRRSLHRLEAKGAVIHEGRKWRCALKPE